MSMSQEEMCKNLQKAGELIFKNPFKNLLYLGVCFFLFVFFYNNDKISHCILKKISPDLQLYHSETLELMLQRWSKLERDFRMKNGRYDISKIPDIYDCIKYDLQHNASLDLEDTRELFRLSRALADIVIPQVNHINVFNCIFLSAAQHLFLNSAQIWH